MVDRTTEKLGLMNPEHTLGRGYAIIQDEQGAVVMRAAQVRVGQDLQARILDARLRLSVEGIDES